jgi:hypothetical protein
MTVVRPVIGLALVLALFSAAPGRAQESKDKADAPKPLAAAKHDKGLIVEFWAKFPRPEATITRIISLHLPETEPIGDLAIQQSTEK